MADDPLPDPNVVVADTAALAANSAERAQAAAADAIVNAQTAAAGVAVVAAEETRQTEERLAEWQSSIQSQHEKLSQNVMQDNEATQPQLGQALDQHSSIRSRRASPPESPASRGAGPPSGPTSGPEPP